MPRIARSAPNYVAAGGRVSDVINFGTRMRGGGGVMEEKRWRGEGVMKERDEEDVFRDEGEEEHVVSEEGGDEEEVRSRGRYRT